MESLDRFVTEHGGAFYNAAFYGPIIFFALIELVAPRRALTWPLGARWLANIGLGALDFFVGRWATVIVGVGAAEAMGALGHGLLNVLGVPALLAFVLAFLVLDLTQYAIHRILHTAPWLWRCHRLHHADPDVDFTTSRRHHPLELVVTLPVYTLVIVLLGAPDSAVLIHGAVSAAAATFNHANLAVPPWLDRALRLVLVTPDMHRIHHSARQPETDSNYANLFSWWDRIFGSYRATPEGGHDRMRLGLDGFHSRADLGIVRLLGNPFLAPASMPAPNTR
ncbi:MAG: sterol desaturase family protein [Alphaproteobacteria bacterium]